MILRFASVALWKGGAPGPAPSRLLAAAALTLLGVAPAAGQAPDARQIVDQVDRLLQAESSHGRVAMEIETANWSRSLELEMWSLGTDNALIRVLSPAREAGTTTLKTGDQVWNYLPRVDRTIRIPSSLMGASWMGSHFTNDDLVRKTRLVDDYAIETTFQGQRDGARVWEFTLSPRARAAVVWGRLVMEVRQEDRMPVWIRYFDEDGKLSRVTTYHDYRVFGGRRIPTRIVTQPADLPNERTVFRVREARFDIGLEPSFFSLRNLRDRG